MNPKTFEWLWRLIITVLISAGAWFGKEVWDGQIIISKQIQTLEVANAKAEGSRFTATDWQREKSLLETRLGYLETKQALSDQKLNMILNTLDKFANRLPEIRSKP